MKQFKTESKKLLDLMINSIYTNKEIFLRELISNASDAIDKLYFKSLTDSSVEITKDDLAIRIEYDKNARVITVSDNGIGMTKDELDLNLGTIAHSDSLAFKDENDDAQGADIDIIGQFGVGFYSAFMVSTNVRVVSRAYGADEAYEWESNGIDGYTIRKSERLEHGTDVILMIKPSTADEDYDRFLVEDGLVELIQRYSNYVRYPVQMRVSKTRMKPIPQGAPEDYKPQYETFMEIDTINSMIPIWKRKDDVTDAEYNEFYKVTYRDWTDPLRRMTIHAEGTLSYDALLFIPGKQPYDFMTTDYEKGLQLYSSNVLIMDKCADLLPEYFSFVQGVVDSQDLSLNISRETLQQNSQLRAIERRVEKKVKQELADMRDNAREDYEKFFDLFGRSMKFAVYTSYGEAADAVSDLFIFYSAKQQKMVTLDEYIAEMPEEQPSILYAAGDSVDKLAKLPIVTTVLGHGYDVLLCTDRVDDFCLQSMHQYKEKELKNVSSGDLGLESQDEKEAAEAIAKDNADLFATMKDALGDRVKDVVISTKLTDFPSCVTAAGPISLEMERVMSAVPERQDIKSEHVLEINPQHEIFEVLKDAHDHAQYDKVELYTEILYDQALLIEGLPIADPVAYAKAVTSLMV